MEMKRCLFLFSIFGLLWGSVAEAHSETGDVPKLGEQLEKLSAEFDAKAPANVKALVENDVAALVKSNLVEKAVGVGDKAPKFTLRNAVREEVSLDALLEKGPVVLTYYRGGWCPYCNATLRAYEEALPEIKKAGGQLVALTPEIPDKSLSTKEKHDLTYEILTDGGQTVARIYGLVYTLSPEVAKFYRSIFDMREYNGPDAAYDELPIAATYVIDRSGTVRWAFLDPDYRKRAEPADIIEALKKIAGPSE